MQIKELYNLQQLAQAAQVHNLPIMLAFGAEWCEFCEQLKEEVLDPMALGGEYEGKWMLMRYVSIDDPEPFIFLDGTPKIKSKWFDELNLDVTPVVIFLDSQGHPLAEPIVGISNIEFFPLLVHQHLNQCYQKLGNPIRIGAIQP